MLRMLLVGLMILPFTAVARQQDNSLALAHYHNAVQAFEQGDLASAESLANKAIALLATDGEAHTNIRASYTYSLVGRQQLPKQTIVSDKHDYQPNSLLLKIEQARQDMVLREQYIQKRAAPPQLVISQKEIIDSDNNGILSGLESVRLLLTIKNTGVHSAEDVAINIVTPGLAIPQPFISKSLGTLDASQQRQVEFNFDMPKHIPASFRQFTVQLTEKDGLGERQEAIIPKQMQSWLPPCLEVTPLPEQSDPIIANRNATLRYQLQNCGDTTAWDVSLSLTFGRVQGIHIVHNLNLQSVEQLRAGESTVLAFTVRTTQNALGNFDNVFYLKHHSKGSQPTTIALAAPKVSATTDNGQLALWQAKRNQQQLHIANPALNLAAVVVTGYQQLPEGQINNAVIASKVMQQRLGINAQNTDSLAMASQQQWQNYLLKTLPAQLRETNANTLHMYIAAGGMFDERNGVLLQFETAFGVTFSQNLERLYQHLAALPVEHVVLWLEAPLAPIHSEKQPAFLVKRELPAPPPKMSVFAAAMPGSHTFADVYTGSGMFTTRVNEGLGGLADSNSDSIITTHELSVWLQQDIPQATLITSSQAQFPAFAGEALTLNILNKEY